jgi:hypothetical protein
MIDEQADATCLFCGEPERVSLFEVWVHDFMLETCCAGLHEQIIIDMNDDPAWARQLLRSLELEEICGHALRRVADDGACSLVLDWQLRLDSISHKAARNFVERHHTHCSAPRAWRFHRAIFNGWTLLGVAIVGNPVARALAGRGIVEVRRLCVRRDLPRPLRWNAASMLYGWCGRAAEQRGWSKIITYTRADEAGTSLEAAGWVREAKVHGRGWHSAERRRSNRNAWIDKVRWSRILTPTRDRPPANPRSHSWPWLLSTEPTMDGLALAWPPKFDQQRPSSSTIAPKQLRYTSLMSPEQLAAHEESTSKTECRLSRTIPRLGAPAARDWPSASRCARPCPGRPERGGAEGSSTAHEEQVPRCATTPPGAG